MEIFDAFCLSVELFKEFKTDFFSFEPGSFNALVVKTVVSRFASSVVEVFEAPLGLEDGTGEECVVDEYVADT